MSLTFEMPAWLSTTNRNPQQFANLETAMDFVLEATARNIAEGGGPFGAAVLTAELNLRLGHQPSAAGKGVSTSC